MATYTGPAEKLTVRQMLRYKELVDRGVAPQEALQQALQVDQAPVAPPARNRLQSGLQVERPSGMAPASEAEQYMAGQALGQGRQREAEEETLRTGRWPLRGRNEITMEGLGLQEEPAPEPSPLEAVTAPAGPAAKPMPGPATRIAGLPSAMPGMTRQPGPPSPVEERGGLLARLGGLLGGAGKAIGGTLNTPDRKLKALEILGTLGAAYFGSRDTAAAGKRTAQSQARANLTNALSRRARSQGTVSEPRMGLGSTLMNSLAMAGRGGQEALQQERGQAQQAFERTQAEKKTGQAERGLDLEEQRDKWQHENDQARIKIDRETNEIRRIQATAQAAKAGAAKKLPKDVLDNLGKLMSTAQSLRAFRKQLKDYAWTGPIGGRVGALLPQAWGGDVRRSLEQKANLLAYELAAIEGQTNRSLSDMDRKMFAEALTGLTDFSSTQDLKLDTLDTLLQQHILGMTKIYQADGYDTKAFLVMLDELSGTGVQAGQEESGGEELDEEERQAIQDYADEQGLTFEEARAKLDRMMEEEE